MIKELNYELIEKDLDDYAKDCLDVKRYKKKRLLETVIDGSIFFLIVFILYIFQIGICTLTFIFSILFALGIMVFAYFWYPIMLKIQIKQLNKDLAINNTIVIKDDNNLFKLTNNISSSEIQWSSIKNIYNCKSNIILFIRERQSIIIPKRIFETEQEMNETWELIQECYNKYKEVE